MKKGRLKKTEAAYYAAIHCKSVNTIPSDLCRQEHCPVLRSHTPDPDTVAVTSQPQAEQDGTVPKKADAHVSQRSPETFAMHSQVPVMNTHVCTHNDVNCKHTYARTYAHVHTHAHTHTHTRISNAGHEDLLATAPISTVLDFEEKRYKSLVETFSGFCDARVCLFSSNNKKSRIPVQTTCYGGKTVQWCCE